MIKVIWLGFAVPEDLAKQIFDVDAVPAIQTYKFGWSFARVLKLAFDEVFIVSSAPVRSYPLVPIFFFRGKSFYREGMNGYLIGFLNFLLLKHVTRLIGCFCHIFPIFWSKKIDYIFVHGVHTPYLLFCWFAKLWGVKTIAVLTDPPGVVLSTDGAISRILKKADRVIVAWLIRQFHAVISLAPDLANMLAPNAPALIMPGIVESGLDVVSADALSGGTISSEVNSFVIVYAGGLSRSYGVDLLIDAVVDLDRCFNVKLKLFGRGEEEERIRGLSETDPRIFYGGFVESNKLIPIIRSADLLINPRPTHQLFASLSFPSKLIEYLAVGRPVLTTRVPSIPQDLEKAFLFIEDESIEGIKAGIIRVVSMPEEERLAHSQSALMTVRSLFSEQAVARRISGFIADITNTNRKAQ